MTQSIADEVESRINELLMFLHLCEDDRHTAGALLKEMDGAVPLLMFEQTRNLGFFQNDGAPALWPVDVGLVLPASADAAAGSLQFSRFRTIGTKEARMRGAVRFSPQMVIDSVVIAQPNGKSTSGAGIYSRLLGQWQDARAGRTGLPDNWRERVELGLGMALTMRYEWSVWLGHGAGPRVRFITDPLGVREIFRLRDLPPGRERRAALRHWVTAHWRAKRSEAADRAWVRRHLRGAEDFIWQDLRCRVSPPAFDVEQLAVIHG